MDQKSYTFPEIEIYSLEEKDVIQTSIFQFKEELAGDEDVDW